jgi:HD-GYP domain-containing protein (c-di-GMP phosphodiesterase class II)/Flp pilus assembly protein TadD
VDTAQMAEQSGEWDDALEGYRAAIERIHAGEEPQRGPTVLRWIGRVYFERGDYDEAHAAFEASLVNSQVLQQRKDAASALNGMAVVEQFRGRLDVAEALYGRACVIADEVGDRQLAAMIDQNLGILANVRGDLGTALVRYQSSLDRFRQLRNDRSCAQVLNNMGMLHIDVGEWAAAELCFTSAYQLSERSNDDSTRAKVESNRAELYLKRQNFERARECCERAFKTFSMLGSDTGLGEVHKFYGVLYRETGKPQVANVQLGLALKLARSCENPLLEAETESERARLFLNTRQVPQALQSLNRAHKIFCELDARREILDLRRRLERLETTYVQAIQLWTEDVPVLDMPNTLRRGKRVAELASSLANAVGYGDIVWLRIGAFLRDVGNRTLPKEVLDKPGPLTAEEYLVVQNHTVAGDSLVQELEFPADIRPMVRNHHEHWDGTGYPDGLKGEHIPLAARIICLADVYDALTSVRSYRGAFSSEQALEIMEQESGKIFDPNLFRTFASLIRLGGTSQRNYLTEQLRKAV